MPRQKKPTTDTVRVEEDLAHMAVIVAGARRVSVPAYLSGLLRPLVTADYEATVRDLAGKLPAADPKPRKPKAS